jgi:hypothetical protein
MFLFWAIIAKRDLILSSEEQNLSKLLGEKIYLRVIYQF